VAKDVHLTVGFQVIAMLSYESCARTIHVYLITHDSTAMVFVPIMSNGILASLFDYAPSCRTRQKVGYTKEFVKLCIYLGVSKYMRLAKTSVIVRA